MENNIDRHTYGPVLAYQTTIYLLAILVMVPYSVYYFLSNLMWPFLTGLFIMLSFGLSLLFSQKRRFYCAISLGVMTLIFSSFLHVHFFGIGCGSHYYLLAANVLLSINNRKKRIMLPITLTIAFSYFAILFLFKNESPVYHIPDMHLRFIHEANLITAFTFLTLSFFRYAKALRAAEMELERYHGKVAYMAHTDALTDLPNRRTVENELRQVISSTGEERGFAVALGDLDNFKGINDTYGHQCGDKVLKEIASRFRKSIRSYDVLGRWGGEEFLFIFKDASIEMALQTLERIRETTISTPIPCTNASLNVTATFGITHYREGDSQESLFERVDKLLYKGKEAGRNRIMSDPV